MSDTADRVVVEIAGDVRSLVAACRQAAASLQGVAAEAQRQVRVADQSAAVNTRVAGSLTATGKAAQTAATGLNETAAASAKAGTAAKGAATATDAQAAANKQAAVTAKTSAVAQDANSVAVTRAGVAHQTAAAQVQAHRNQLSRLGADVRQTGKGMSDFGSAVGRIALPLAFIGYESIKTAATFQQQMTLLQTSAGASTDEVKRMSDAVLSLSTTVNTKPQDLAKGLFPIESAGHRGAAALDVLRAAAMGAKAGNADLSQTASVLVSALAALHEPASAAATVMGKLVAITGQGKMTLQDLVAAMGTGVLPVAKRLGLGLNDVGAALDTLTINGIPAEKAATQLQRSFMLMLNPTTQAAAALSQIGLSQSQLANDMQKPGGLMVALQDLRGHLDQAFPPGRKLTIGEEQRALAAYRDELVASGVSGKKLNDDLGKFQEQMKSSGSSAVQQAQLISTAFGRSRGAAGMMVMLNSVDQLHQHIDALGQVNGPQTLQQAFSASEKTMGASLERLQVSLQTTEIQLGRALGPVVIPMLQTVAHDVEGIAHWFEQLPPGVRKAAVEFTALSVVLAGAAKIMGTLGQGVGWWMTVAGKILPGGPGGVAGKAGQALGGGGGIGGLGGIRGLPSAPGGYANPLGVVMLNGAGGFNLPAGAMGGEGAAAEKAIAGETSSLKSMFATALGRGAAGVGVGLTGVAVSQLAGALVGGKTGHTVSSIGTDASIGAGVGSLAGPEGAVIGAVGGALVGGLTALLSSPTVEQKVGDAIAKPLSTIGKPSTDAQKTAAQQAAQLGGQVTDLLKRADALSPSHQVDAGPHSAGRTVYDPVSAKTSAEQGALFAQAGQDAARAMDVQLQTFKHIDPSTVIRDFVLKFQDPNIPHRMREAAAQAMVAWAEGMQKNGQLPKHSVDAIIASLEQRFPDVKAAFAQAGIDSSKSFASSLRFDQAQNATAQMITDFKTQWSAMPPLAKNTGQGIVTNITTELQFLRTQAKYQTGEFKTAALKDIADLKTQGSTYMHQLTANVGREGVQLAAEVRSGSNTAKTTMISNFTTMVGSVEALVQDGVVKIGDAMATINRELDRELTALGVSKSQISKYVGTNLSPADATATLGQAANGSLQNRINQAQGTGKATGGWIGAQGEKGRDQVPVVVGRGEAIVSHDQQQPIQTALAYASAHGVVPYGSLGEVFTGERRPHYMAQGGFAGGGQSSALARMVAEASAINSHHYPYVWGGGHNGSFSGPYDCSGAVSAVLHAGGMLGAPEVAQQFMSYGLPGPGAVTLFASPSHVYMSLGGRYFGTHGADGASWFSGGPRPGFVERHPPLGAQGALIPVPKIGMGGAVGAVGQAVLGKAAHAASDRLSQALMASTAGGQTGGGDMGTFTGGFGSGSWQTELQKIAKAKGWNAADWEWIVNAESSGVVGAINGGGVWRGPGNYTDTSRAFGLGQFLGSSLTNYAKYGSESPDGVKQIDAMAQYISDRYGNPTAAKAFHLSHNWYATGGYAGQASAAKAKKTTLPKKAGGHATTTKSLSPAQIAKLGQAVAAITANDTTLDTLQRTYSDAQARFAATEGDLTDANGQPVPAAVQQRIADLGVLLGLDNQMLAIRQGELATIPGLLKEIGLDKGLANSTISQLNSKITQDKTRIGALRDERRVLAMPPKSGVPAAEHKIQVTRQNYAKAIKPLEGALHGAAPQDGELSRRRNDLAHVPAGKAHDQARRLLHARIVQLETERQAWKHDITAKRDGLKGNETTEVAALQNAVYRLRSKEADARRKRELKRLGLAREIDTLTARDRGLAKQVTAEGKLAGGDTDDVNYLQGRLQALGDPTRFGEIYNTQTDVLSLQGQLAKVQAAGSPAAAGPAAADNSQIIALLQQQNQLGQSLSLSQAQFGAFSGFAQMAGMRMVGSFAVGGRIPETGIALVHKDEYITSDPAGPYNNSLAPERPPWAAPSAGGRGGGDVHLHMDGEMSALMDLVDARITRVAPDAVSRNLGRRGRLIAAGPGF